MPSPVGHALGGMIFGWLVAGRRPSAERTAWYADPMRPPPVAPAILRPPRLVPVWWMQAAVFGLLGMLPDIDFLWGMHNMHTHSIGAAAVVGAAAALLVRPGSRLRLGLGAAAAYGSHVLLDWMNQDTSPPIGIMALWPFSHEHYQSDLYLFMAIWRRYRQEGFWVQNLAALARELLVLVPLVVLVWWGRQQRSDTQRSAGL